MLSEKQLSLLLPTTDDDLFFERAAKAEGEKEDVQAVELDNEFNEEEEEGEPYPEAKLLVPLRQLP